jgi:hypothetical protein
VEGGAQAIGLTTKADHNGIRQLRFWDGLPGGCRTRQATPTDRLGVVCKQGILIAGCGPTWTKRQIGMVYADTGTEHRLPSGPRALASQRT